MYNKVITIICHINVINILIMKNIVDTKSNFKIKTKQNSKMYFPKQRHDNLVYRRTTKNYKINFQIVASRVRLTFDSSRYWLHMFSFIWLYRWIHFGIWSINIQPKLIINELALFTIIICLKVFCTLKNFDLNMLIGYMTNKASK